MVVTMTHLTGHRATNAPDVDVNDPADAVLCSIPTVLDDGCRNLTFQTPNDAATGAIDSRWWHAVTDDSAWRTQY